MTPRFHSLVKSLLVAALLALAASGTAGAATLQLRAWLNGAQVPLAVGGTGLAIVTFDTDTKVLTWNVSYQGLSSACTDADFHGPAPAGVNTGIAVAIGCTGGTPLSGSASLDATQEAQLLSGQWYINIQTANNSNGEIRGQVVAVRGDFNGDGQADVVWRNLGTGDNYLYLMNGRSILPGEGYLRHVVNQSWQIAGIGDFDGDGKADILWRNVETGENYIYFMDGRSIVGEGYVRTVADPNWKIVGIGDFDGDGRSDILWRNSSTGQNYIYPMAGLKILPSEGYLRTVADQNWRVAGIGDFDGDGRSDILWRNSTTGQNYLYPMAGRTVLAGEGYLRTVADQNWRVVGVGDFDGDGRSDILWRNSATGQNYVYAMAGRTILPTEGYLRTIADQNWRVEGIGDFDGDGRSDILWRNSATGQNYFYPMAGRTILPTEGYTRTVADSDWKITPIASPSVTAVSGLLNHNATVIITGSGFGSKPQSAPVVWDDASTGELVTDNGKWDGFFPTPPSTTYLRYTAPIRDIALPHTHISRYIAGGHGGAEDLLVLFWKERTMAAYPQYTYISWYQRADDKWVFGGDNNYKMYDFSAGGQPYYGALTWYTAFEPPLPDSPSAPAKWVVNDDCLGQSCETLTWPDNNGHNFFWNFGVNPFSGVWSKVEMEIKWTNQSNGYIKQWQDGALVINYSGPTDRYDGNDRAESVGGYARNYGQENNWRYWADVYLDYSPARVVLANNAKLSAATIREVQVPSSWSDGSINVTVNLGRFTTGETAYLFVFDPTGVANGVGFPIAVQ